MSKKIPIDWVEFLKDVKALSLLIKGKETPAYHKINKIVAISNGGLIPAYYLAKYLGVKVVECLPVVSYDEEGNKLKKPKTIPENRKVDSRIGWLIVDDLVDSGDTLKIAKELYPKAKMACLYKKPGSPSPDFYLSEKKGWVVFPWEEDMFSVTIKI